MIGCVSQKPLPYSFSTAKQPVDGAPKLAVTPVVSVRANQEGMGKVLALPTCLNSVIVSELQASGAFSTVVFATNDIGTAGLKLDSKLGALDWEVPNYDRILGTVFLVSLCTGGVGGVVYGVTETDVFGHATVHFTLTDMSSSSVLLDRDYLGKYSVRKAKLSCDTPDSYREVAAGAFKSVMDQFEADVQKLNTKQ